MNVIVKYFKFDDPITGYLSKTVGWIQIVNSQDVTVKVINNVATITKNEWKEMRREVLPRYVGQTEILKDVYDALDVSNEDPSSATRRERAEASLSKLLAYASTYQDNVDRSEILRQQVQALIDG